MLLDSMTIRLGKISTSVWGLTEAIVVFILLWTAAGAANRFIAYRLITYSNLTCDIKVIEEKVPQKGGSCSVFIDIIELPLTPLLYAGVTRRSVYRRW